MKKDKLHTKENLSNKEYMDKLEEARMMYPHYLAVLNCILHKKATVADSLRLMGIYEKEKKD